jgi:2-dehydropantoate 2-reductase
VLDVLLAGFRLPTTKTTVLQDWMRGRHSEVDDLNGFVAMEAKRLGLRAPMNEAIAELAHRVEMGVLNATPENLRLVADFASA